ncbi:t-SNARE [Daedalea quercina L-15889]|uniref:t-SNARE n=1 Tax=Daedalea quercina L-15889 TaxID=1314783 RepID=A0A165NEA0_9APHY|nr:t-SNARE [Daedalea quercina L-15889]
MFRDTLTALKPQGQQQQQQQAQDGQPLPYHEMTGLQTLTASSTTVGVVNRGDTMARFYGEVSSILDDLAEFRSNVQQIGELHSHSLNSTDENANRGTSALLDDLMARTRQLSNDLKERIQALSRWPAHRPQDTQIRNNQTGVLRTKFVEVLQKYKQRVERQFRIVKPDATPEEIDEVVNRAHGGDDRVFAQALTNSTRYGESRQAHREIQDRHQDMQRIERTLEELAQMFNDISVLVNQQEESIDAIQDKAGDTEKDIEKGLEHTEKAVVHARRARRMRWICFAIVLIICAVLAIALGATFGPGNKH